MSALMLAAVLVVWLGLWGPIELGRLEKWQTLLSAFIAPSIAVIAARIAYRAAMAKVEFDREESRRRRNSERIGLYVRFRASLRSALSGISRTVGLIGERGILIEGERFRIDDIRIAAPAEVNEAWEKIHLLPPSLVASVELLHRQFPLIEADLARSTEEDRTVRYVKSDFSSSLHLDGFLGLHVLRGIDVAKACERIIDGLGDEISRIQQLD